MSLDDRAAIRTIRVLIDGNTLELTYDADALGRGYAEAAQSFAPDDRLPRFIRGFAGRGGAMFFLARKFERSQRWFCHDAISISGVGVPLMKN